MCDAASDCANKVWCTGASRKVWSLLSPIQTLGEGCGAKCSHTTSVNLHCFQLFLQQLLPLISAEETAQVMPWWSHLIFLACLSFSEVNLLCLRSEGVLRDHKLLSTRPMSLIIPKLIQLPLEVTCWFLWQKTLFQNWKNKTTNQPNQPQTILTNLLHVIKMCERCKKFRRFYFYFFPLYLWNQVKMEYCH